MPDFGMFKSHIGHAGRLASDHKIDAFRMADKCEVCRTGTGTAFDAARNMDGKRLIENSVPKRCQLLGNRPRRDVTGGAGRVSRTGRDAQTRVGGVDNQTVARGDGLKGSARGCLPKKQDRPARRDADFGHACISGNAAETREARCFDLAEWQADAKRSATVGKVEDADRAALDPHP
jgi:hypothetical protein